MILFEWVEVKNFMNYGNVPTKLTLNTHRNTHLAGKNGSGKSSILLDSICYVFFGKPYRDIKLGQLINSINNKGMVVKGAFTRGDDSFVVTRGQKPSVFLIEKNGIPVEEESIRGSYQEYLEGVLGINFMTFKQVVVIGSANYVPFMRLTTPQRREVVETMLPIKIFTEAARIVRERIANTKKELSDIDIKVVSVKDSLKKSKEILESIQKEKSKQVGEIETRRKEINNKLIELRVIRDATIPLSDMVTSTKDKVTKLTQANKSASSSLVKISTEIQSLSETKEFYHQEKCPTCEQVIGEDIRHEMETKANGKIDALEKKREELNQIVAVLQQKQDDLDVTLEKMEEAKQKATAMDWEIEKLEEQLSGLVIKDVSDTEIKVKQNIATSLSEMDSLVSEKSLLVSRQSVLATAQELCKDSGVKSMIVQEFIPLMNQKINHFLQLFDLFVNFELDSEFNETIKSRNRDSFSYNSFSEGEKQRIDLAILFAWREIAIQKNAAVTNLLIFDETLDKSIDADGVDVFMNILENIGTSIHVFVVSHKDVIPEVFDRSIRVEKKNDFALLTIT